MAEKASLARLIPKHLLDELWRQEIERLARKCLPQSAPRTFTVNPRKKHVANA